MILRSGVLMLLAFSLSACAASSPSPEEGPVRVEAMLTVEEFRAAGLDRLDDEELAALNDGLSRALSRGEGLAEDPAVAAWERSDNDPFATFGMADEHPAARRHDRMPTRLAVAVSDWPRGLAIPLENGQVWELVRPGGQGFAAAEKGQQVEIRRASFGSFLLKIGERNKTLRVRRIE